MLRSLLGALQHAAVHSRPDLSAKVGELQSNVTKAKVEDLVTANMVLHEAKVHEVSWMVLPIQPRRVTFCAFSDASFMSNQNQRGSSGNHSVCHNTRDFGKSESCCCSNCLDQ